MIAKISKSSNLHGTVNYNFQKVNDKEAKIILSQNMPLRDNKQQSVIKVFENRLFLNDRTKSPIVHISLNPSPNDIISDEDYSEIAREYMQRMGYGEQPYIIFKHEDIDRHHIHIVTTNVNEQGKKISDSNERYRSKEITNDIEQKYNLSKADLCKDNSIWEPKKIQLSKNIGRQISGVVRHVMTQGYACGSFKEFRSLLSLYNIGIDEVKGEAHGTEFRGAVYAALNDNGERVGSPIKSSRLGKRVSIHAIDQYINKKQPSAENKKNLHDKIYQLIQKASSVEKFKTMLKNNNIDAIILQNNNGRRYGVTWIDHENKIVVSGSKLGKDLSANAINEIVNKWNSHPNTERINKPHIPFEKTNDKNTPVESSYNSAFVDNQTTLPTSPRRRKFDDDEDEAKRKRKKRKYLL